VLSSHTLLIAAIFVPYFVMMATLFVHIIRTGRPGHTNDQDEEDEERDPAPEALPIAA
jgi:hypothetical protein